MTSDYIDPEAGEAREANAGRVGSEGVLGYQRTATARYKFSEDGGAIGVHDLAGDPLPVGAIITGFGFIDVLVPATGEALAAVGLSVETPGDLVPVTTLDGSSYFQNGPIVSIGPSSDIQIPAFKTTAPRKIKATIAVAALTAGEFVVYIDYLDTRV